MSGRHDDYGYPQKDGADSVWVSACKRAPFGFYQPEFERELVRLRRSSDCNDCREQDDMSIEAVVVRPTMRGVSLAVMMRINSRVLTPGMQILSAEAAAELATLQAKRNSPEHRAKIRLEELPPAE
jgi:hypothetical protein